MCTATTAEDYRKEVEVEDLVTRNRRTSTKLKFSNTLARNQTNGSFLVNRTFIKKPFGVGIDFSSGRLFGRETKDRENMAC